VLGEGPEGKLVWIPEDEYSPEAEEAKLRFKEKTRIRRIRVTRSLLAAICALMIGATTTAHAAPQYSIQAIRYATAPGVTLSDLVVDGPKNEKVDIAMVVWLIRGGGRNILFDSGFHR